MTNYAINSIPVLCSDSVARLSAFDHSDAILFSFFGYFLGYWSPYLLRVGKTVHNVNRDLDPDLMR